MPIKYLFQAGNYISQVEDTLYGSFVEHLGRAVYTGIYTTTLTEAGQFSVIASQWTGSRLNSGVTVGKISSGIKEAVSETAAKDFPSLRLFYAGTEGSAYDLFVLCPAVFACREFEEGDGSALQYWRIHIEKIY